MKNFLFAMLWIVMAFSLVTYGQQTMAPTPASKPQIKSTESVLIEDIVNSSQFFASPDLRQVVYTKMVDKKTSLVVGGREGKQYDGIFSVIFSPDGKHVAYQAEKGGKWFTVLDGQEGHQYNDPVSFLTFSPDVKHFAYTTKSYEATLGMKGFIVLDGVEGPHFSSSSAFVFS